MRSRQGLQVPRKLERRGAIAQLGERLLCKQEVTGSIPVGSTLDIASDHRWSRRFRVRVERVWSATDTDWAAQLGIILLPPASGSRRETQCQLGPQSVGTRLILGQFDRVASSSREPGADVRHPIVRRHCSESKMTQPGRAITD